MKAMERPLALNDLVKGRAEDTRNGQNEGMFPPQPVPVGETKPVCGGVEAYNERSLHISMVAKGYRLRFYESILLHKTPWEIRSPHGPKKYRNETAISLMLQKNAITDMPPDSPEFFPGMQSVRRVTFSNRLKTTKCLHFRTSHLSTISPL